jgi:glycerol-3-phosphate dehydrogenase
MTYHDELPARVRVLILGGGIHGTGVLHDLASRGWHDIHLLEKAALGDGTSSRSTKLIHGGLRYLRRLSDIGLVSEGLRERQLLMQLAPDLVHPVELLFPILRQAGMPRFMVKTGLSLYDRLAGRYRIETHRTLTAAEAAARAPQLNQELCKAVYSFWDGQTDDLGLVCRVAASARKLGAGVTEGCRALRLSPTEDGWSVEVRGPKGEQRTISALYVVNCLGPWANGILDASGIAPTHQGINNKGIHLLFDDMGLKAGLFLQSLKGDGRIFFMLPWKGFTLVGTTEDLYSGNPDQVGVEDADVQYLLANCNAFLKAPLKAPDIRGSFAGLRWLAVEAGHGLSDTSRHHVIGERSAKRGLLMTLYGGKLTTYRNLARSIGDRVTTHFGEFRPSRTDQPDTWASAAETPEVPGVARRFSA